MWTACMSASHRCEYWYIINELRLLALCACFADADWLMWTIKVNASESERLWVAEHLKFLTAILEIVRGLRRNRVENKSELLALEAHSAPVQRPSWTWLKPQDLKGTNSIVYHVTIFLQRNDFNQNIWHIYCMLCDVITLGVRCMIALCTFLSSRFNGLHPQDVVHDLKVIVVRDLQI